MWWLLVWVLTWSVSQPLWLHYALVVLPHSRSRSWTTRGSGNQWAKLLGFCAQNNSAQTSICHWRKIPGPGCGDQNGKLACFHNQNPILAQCLSGAGELLGVFIQHFPPFSHHESLVWNHLAARNDGTVQYHGFRGTDPGNHLLAQQLAHFWPQWTKEKKALPTTCRTSLTSLGKHLPYYSGQDRLCLTALGDLSGARPQRQDF